MNFSPLWRLGRPQLVGRSCMVFLTVCKKGGRTCCCGPHHCSHYLTFKAGPCISNGREASSLRIPTPSYGCESGGDAGFWLLAIFWESNLGLITQCVGM